MNKTPVVATSYQQYVYWLSSSGRDPSLYFYASNPRKLYGYRRDTKIIVLTGHPDEFKHWIWTDVGFDIMARFDKVKYERT